MSCTLEGGGPTGTPGTTPVAQGGSGGITGITVEAGKTTTCTFANTKRGDLKLVKNTTGGDGTFNFSHSIAGLDSSLTTVSGTKEDTSNALVPGSSYVLSETVPAGWDLNGIVCKLDNGTGAETGSVDATPVASGGSGGVSGITVEAGKTTVCTFENEPRSAFTISFDSLPNPAVTEALVNCEPKGDEPTAATLLLDLEYKTFNNLPVGEYSCTIVIQALTP